MCLCPFLLLLLLLLLSFALSFKRKQLLYMGGVFLSVAIWDKPGIETGILSPFGNGGIA